MRELAHLFPVARRRKPVENLDHLLPVQQHVEGDDGRHHDHGDDIDQGDAARQQRPREPADIGRVFADEIIDVFLQIQRRHRGFEPVLPQKGVVIGSELFAPFGEELLQGREITRQAGDEALELARQQGEQQQSRQADDQNEHAEQQNGRPQPRQARRLQAIRDRVEQIAEHGAGDEGRQYRTQGIEQREKGEQRESPEQQLTLQAHARLRA